MAFDARCFPEVLTVTTRRVLLDTIIGHGIGNTLRALAPGGRIRSVWSDGLMQSSNTHHERAQRPRYPRPCFSACLYHFVEGSESGSVMEFVGVS
jgi:hypothetical protein